MQICLAMGDFVSHSMTRWRDSQKLTKYYELPYLIVCVYNVNFMATTVDSIGDW